MDAHISTGKFGVKNGKMSDGEDQVEQPAAAMAMPVMNVNDNAGIMQPTYLCSPQSKHWFFHTTARR